MDTTAVKTAMLSAISEELDLWLSKEKEIKDGYEYESEFMKTAHQVNRILLRKSIGTVSSNRGKKKLHTCFGAFAVNKTHVLCRHTEKFGISSKLQEMICLLGQECVFEEGSELFEKFLGIDVSAKQIQRVSEYYGGQLEELEARYQEESESVPVVLKSGSISIS